MVLTSHRTNKMVPPSYLDPREKHTQAAWQISGLSWNMQYRQLEWLRAMGTCLRPLAILWSSPMKQSLSFVQPGIGVLMKATCLTGWRSLLGQPDKHRWAGGTLYRPLSLPNPTLGRHASLFSLNGKTETSLSFDCAKTSWNWWHVLVVPNCPIYHCPIYQWMINKNHFREPPL